MKKVFTFFVVAIVILSCRGTRVNHVVFPEYKKNIDTVSIQKLRDVIAHIKPQTLCPLNNSGFHVGGSSFTSRLYVVDLNKQAIIDSLQLNATDSHSIFFSSNKTYLYNATSTRLYYLNFSSKIDTIFAGAYNFSMDKNEYVANYNERKILCPSQTGFSLLVAYGDNNSQPPNYLGDHVFKMIPDSHKPFGAYPSTDYEKKKVFRSVVFDKDTAGNIFYCSEMADRLVKIDMSGKLLAEIKFSDYATPEYDKRRKGDLAYLRKYEMSTEFNCDLSLIGQHIYLLKRKAKTKLQAPDMYDLFIFTPDLRPVAKISGLPDLIPFITKDQSAICLFNMKRNEMYKIY